MATLESCKTWLAAHMCAAFKAEVSAKEQEILAHTLLVAENLEDAVHLKFGNSHALVLSTECDRADETILKHYGDERLGLPCYAVYHADACYGKMEKKLRVTRLAFAELSEKEEMIPMPEDVCPKLYAAAQEHDDVAYKFFPAGAKGTLCFAWRNVQRRNFLGRLVAMFRRYKLSISGIRCSYIRPLSVKSVLLGKIELVGANCGDEYQMHRLRREFELLKNFRGNDVLEPLVEAETITGNQANLLRAFTSLIGQILGDVDVALYTESNIVEAFANQVSLTVDLLKIFEAKFLPQKHDLALSEKLAAEFEAKLKKLDTGMRRADDRRRAIFYQALSIVRHTLRTNMYECEKLGISFRLNPAYMDNVPGFDRKKKFPDLPFGVYFVKGLNYFAFQVRFRDLARGGMRTIITWDAEHEANERPNMFTECYNLAFTQQKKNKDIPEGGSKSILFLSANEELAKDEELAARELRLQGLKEDQVKERIAAFHKEHTYEYMYYNQRCFTKTFLKTFIWDHEKKCLMYGANTVDYLKTAEYIYLGPDENFTDELINWVANESKRLGYYPVGGAFISGKDKVGVNHKEFGVTSWGCFHFMVECLKYKGWHESKKFTVKITGGPDGDVAGNSMLLLKKYYPKQAVVLEVTDGSGCAYDPEGFCLDALEQMFHKVQMMQDYPADKLHEGGWIVCARRTRQPTPLTKEALKIKKVGGKVVEEWISFSEANHLWSTTAHTVKADVFLPSGGRPRALNMTNIDSFLINGVPTAEVIVEGANLYITPDAREFLEDKGVLLMRDSSANKCGVISSSYEILGGLSLADEDFIKIKKTLASNILERLEQVALAEARCMMAHWLKNDKKVRMTKISEIVSAKINKYTDDMAAYLKPLDLNKPENKPLLDICINYIPACIREGHLERAMTRIPDMHKKAIISTKIATDLVYGKGLDWEPSVADILPSILKH